MAHPELATHALDGGASSVHFIRCPADDCANPEGDMWLQQRLDGSRRPRLRRQLRDAPISTAWIAPDATAAAIPPAIPARTASASIRQIAATDMWPQLVPATLLVLVIGLATVALSTIRFDPGGNDQARIELALDHHDGAPLLLDPDRPLPADGEPARLLLEVDGAIVLDSSYPLEHADAGNTSLAFERVAVIPGTHDIRVTLDNGSESIVVFDDLVALEAGQSLTVDILDAQIVASADAGRSLYFETTIGTNAGCRICHSLDPNVTVVGPSFAGVATHAASRVPGMTAEEYLRQSIVAPDAYVVDGFSAGQMIPTYLDLLSEEDIDNLVAFLLTLEDE